MKKMPVNNRLVPVTEETGVDVVVRIDQGDYLELCGVFDWTRSDCGTPFGSVASAIAAIERTGAPVMAIEPSYWLRSWGPMR